MERSDDFCAGKDTLFQIYQLAIRKKVTFPYKSVLHIDLLEKPHPRVIVLHTLNRVTSSAEHKNILLLFTSIYSSLHNFGLQHIKRTPSQARNLNEKIYRPPPISLPES